MQGQTHFLPAKVEVSLISGNRTLFLSILIAEDGGMSSLASLPSHDLGHVVASLSYRQALRLWLTVAVPQK